MAELSGDNPTAFSIDNNYLEASGKIIVSKNTTTIGNYAATLTISDADTQTKTIALSMEVVADPEPTGTFEKFTGTIEEGDYVLVANGTTDALKNTITSDRFDCGTVEVADNKIVNPDKSIIWHIAANDAYWTMYNESTTSYAGGTTSRNQGALLNAVTDLAKWTITVDDKGVYTFENYGRSQQKSDANNKFLSKNGQNAYWATYASGQKNPVLYKKHVDVAVEKPTFSVAGGSYLDAQSVEINCATADADIYYTLDGTDPSSASTPYSGAISISETKTLKAIAIKGGDVSATASATYTIVVPKSVDEIWNEITSDGPTDAYVWGYVSQADVNGNNTYYISVNGSTEGNQLEIFKGDNDGHTISKGDKVVVNGDLTIWGSTKEFASGTGKVVRYSAKGAVTAVVVSGTPTKTTYFANETFETAGLVVTATYANGFSEVVTEGITWGNDLTDHKVAATGTVQVTATVGGVTSAAHGVAIEVSTKTLVSIALSAVEFEVYQGLELPKPIVTATYSEGKPEDVTAWAEFTGYDKTTPGEQTITVSYSFGGGEPIVETYTVTVKPIYNVELAASVAKTLIETAVGETESTEDMIVRGIVSYINDASKNVQTYWISDDRARTNEVEIFKGKYLSGANFTTTNQLKVGDEVVVKGKVVYYNSTTPEFASGKSQLQSLARTPNFEIADVTGFEVGTTDLAVADLTITKDGEGAVTLTSSDKAEFVTIEGGQLHAVAPGTATITANLAANGIYKAATYEFSVTVIAAQVKYAITFDGNGANGGEAPEAIANKAAGAEVTLPANNWTKEGHTFNGWKVINNTTFEEVEVVAGAFEMPASAVTIQAQWAEIPVWATKYSSNVTLTAGSNAQNAKVVISETEYDAVKAGTGSKGGNVTVTVPAQATKLHLHAAGWSGENPAISITAPDGVTISPASISATADAGISSNSPFTLKNDPVGQYFALSLSGNTEEIELTFAVDGGSKRFVLYGVNQEGGIVPVLDHIVVTGTATELEYEVGDVFNPAGLGANAIYTLGGFEQEPVPINAKDIEWSFEPATIAANTTVVTVTATYEGKSAQTNVPVTVTVPEPEIIVSAASLAFNNVAKGTAVADKELTVTLKSVENATLTITGDGASAFSVTPAALTASGTVAVSASSDNVGTFNATLTISDDAGAAEAKTVALSITVEASDDLSGTWNLVTDAAELMPGMQVIIANVADGEGNLYTLGGPNGTSANNRLAVASTATGNVLHPEAGTKVITLVDAGNGKYALQLVNGKYLSAAGSGTNNHLKEAADYNSNQEKWTITIADSKAKIQAASTNRNTIRYNSGNSIFSCYAENGQAAIALYARPFDYSRNVSGNYATICLPKAGQIIGATLYEIAYYGGASKKIFFDEIVNGEMEAGIPYIFQPAAGVEKINVYYSDNTAENVVAGDRNGLIGFYDLNNPEARHNITQDAGYYILYNNQYWLVSGRAAYIANYRAYIKISEIQNTPAPEPTPGQAPRRRVAMSVNDTQTATGFENAEANEAPRKVLINGELFILRGEKMYDAKGQLVK